MSADDPLSLWRLAADLSVEDAAILIAGGDPSAVEAEQNGFGIYQEVKKTTGHRGYAAVFTALRNDILKGQLPALLQYRYREVDEFSAERDSSTWIVSKVVLETLFDQSKHHTLESWGVRIVREPDWSATTVNVEELRSWLRGRGMTSGFFFPAEQPATESLLDPEHDHFAPELALAVTAWRALENETVRGKSAKARVEAWIKDNPQAWQGKQSLSGSACERIATLVNWQREGGAPITGE